MPAMTYSERHLDQTASARWTALDSGRSSFVTRCEGYSQLTLPAICPPDGYNNNDALTHDFQSLGAQAVNHLSNKLMLALFAPSRPFFRLDPSPKLRKELASAGVSPEEFEAMLAQAEADAVRELDRRSIRPKMYEGMKHLIVTGNVLQIYGDKNIRVLGIKNYCVKRDVEGEVLELVIKERVHRLSLEERVVRAIGEDKIRCDNDGYVEMYRWINRREDGDYTMTVWVGDDKLPAAFDGKWTAARLPYRAITWDLTTGFDYGTGLVENYSGDLAALSIMSKATVQAAVLASEFRWLVNPSGMTSPTDFEKSENGAALAGQKGDITLVESGKSSDLQINLNIAQVYINRIGQGFLLLSAVTRQAERVTKEEILRNAEELETSYGGAYSRIAVDVQQPMAYWLMELQDKKITGTDVQPTIVTGLAALSRSGDRDNLVLFLQDLGAVSTLPPELQARLKLGPIAATFASARGLPPSAYLLSEQEFAAKQQQQLREQAISEAANRIPLADAEGVNSTQYLLDQTQQE